MKKILVLTLSVLFSIVYGLNAQNTFEKTFGTTGDNFANDVRLTNDGGYIITGTANFAAGLNADIILIKTDANGDTAWTKLYGGFSTENGNAVAQTFDGGYIVAGSTMSFGAGASDAYLIKTDANGNVTWSKTYGTTNNDAAYGVVQTADGGYVFSGYEKQSGLNEYTHLVKVDASGNVLWSKTFGSNLRKNFAYSLEQTSDHGFIIGGWENRDLGINDDFCLIKTDSNGILQWYKSYGDVGHDQNFSVHQTSDGGFIMAGVTISASAIDVSVVKTDASGNLQWVKNIGGAGADDAYAITETSDGGFVFCGTTLSFGSVYVGYFVKLDASGNIIWSKTMDGNGWDGLYAVHEATDGGLIFAGVKGETYGVSGSLYLVKTDADGNVACNTNVTSPGYAPSILVGTLIANGTSTQTVSTPATVATGGTSETTIFSSAFVNPSGNINACKGVSFNLTANYYSGVTYQWYRNGVAFTGEPSQILTVSNAGNYWVKETSASGCSSTSSQVVVKLFATPKAIVTPLGDLDICQTGFVDLKANAGDGYTYQWRKGNNLIPNATNQIYTATSKGSYGVIVNNNGCSKTSKVVKVIKSCREEIALNENNPVQLSCYPNPSSGIFTISLSMNDGKSGNAIIRVSNELNQIVYAQEVPFANGELQTVLSDDQTLRDGMYLLQVFIGDQVFSKRIMIQQ